MLFSRPEHYNPDKIWYLTEYHPYRICGQRNPDFDQNSAKILDLKQGHDSAISHFSSIIKNKFSFGVDFAVCMVPSSTAGKIGSGIQRVAQIIASASGRTDATSCLVRHTSIRKLAYGGNRDLQVHLQSIRTENLHLIAGKEVILLDDVTTTNNSLLACKQLLMDAGATFVQCVALAKST